MRGIVVRQGLRLWQNAAPPAPPELSTPSPDRTPADRNSKGRLRKEVRAASPLSWPLKRLRLEPSAQFIFRQGKRPSSVAGEDLTPGAFGCQASALGALRLYRVPCWRWG